MSLQPYEHYVGLGNQAADRRWGARLKFFLIGFTFVGAAVGLIAGGNLSYPIVGAILGALLGYAVFRFVLYTSASLTADDLYRSDWCAERGMTYREEFAFPPDAPYANSGDKRKATDAFEGEWNGLRTLFYNFTYTDEGDSDDPDTNYDFKIMRLQGSDLPIDRLTIHRRSGLNRFAWADKLQGAMTKERPVSLESVAFNEQFDLTIDDAADEIWIRRTFDPATIQAAVDGSAQIPDLKYALGSWWFVEKEHFEIRDLEQWPTKQQTAANAVQLLSRIQTL